MICYKHFHRAMIQVIINIVSPNNSFAIEKKFSILISALFWGKWLWFIIS